MAENLNTENIKSEFVPILSALIKDVAAAAEGKARLLSGVLYGSAATRDYIRGRSDLNVLLVFDSAGLPLMRVLRGVFKKHHKKLKSNPVVIEESFISKSARVFPMEYYEWKEKGVTFYGDELFDGHDVPMECLWFEIIGNLRGRRMRLEQSFYELGGGRIKIQPFLMATLPNFIVVCRNILRLAGAAVSPDTVSMIGMLERKSGVELRSLKRLVCVKYENLDVGASEIEIIYKELMGEIDGLAGYVDTIKPPRTG